MKGYEYGEVKDRSVEKRSSGQFLECTKREDGERERESVALHHSAAAALTDRTAIA